MWYDHLQLQVPLRVHTQGPEVRLICVYLALFGGANARVESWILQVGVTKQEQCKGVRGTSKGMIYND